MKINYPEIQNRFDKSPYERIEIEILKDGKTYIASFHSSLYSTPFGTGDCIFCAIANLEESLFAESLEKKRNSKRITRIINRIKEFYSDLVYGNQDKY